MRTKIIWEAWIEDSDKHFDNLTVGLNPLQIKVKAMKYHDNVHM